MQRSSRQKRSKLTMSSLRCSKWPHKSLRGKQRCQRLWTMDRLSKWWWDPSWRIVQRLLPYRTMECHIRWALAGKVWRRLLRSNKFILYWTDITWSNDLYNTNWLSPMIVHCDRCSVNGSAIMRWLMLWIPFTPMKNFMPWECNCRLLSCWFWNILRPKSWKCHYLTFFNGNMLQTYRISW